MIALRQMAKAFGGVQTVAEQAHLNPTQLYRTLSASGNPALSSLSAILESEAGRSDPKRLLRNASGEGRRRRHARQADLLLLTLR